jgi:hypothetical protein
MADKPSGAWLLRYNPDRKQFILTVKYHGNVQHFPVCSWARAFYVYLAARDWKKALLFHMKSLALHSQLCAV